MAQKSAAKSKKAPASKAPKAKLPDIEVETAREVIDKVRKSAKQITTSSTAEYFSKNLQQVGFSSPTKAVLTTSRFTSRSSAPAR
jgi:DNA topoisomerase VI subunit B